MFERFTRPARASVVEAQGQARRLGHEQITPEHLLLGVLEQGGVPAHVLAELGLDRETLKRDVETFGSADADALRTIGVDLDTVRSELEATFGPGALDRPRARRTGLLRRRRTGPATGHIAFSGPAKKALEQSLRQALTLGHGSIGVEHILLGLVADDDAMAARTLQRLGVSPDEVRTRVVEALRAPSAGTG